MKIKALLQYVTIWTVLSPCFSGYLFAAQMNALWTSEAGVYAPSWVTREANLFEKYGNHVQLIFIQGATSAAAALISGDAQIAFLSPQVVITSGMQGLDLVMVARLGALHCKSDLRQKGHNESKTDQEPGRQPVWKQRRLCGAGLGRARGT